MDNRGLHDFSMFGIRGDTGRPILERVKVNPCKKCNGFGTYGNPLCGAVYKCDDCKGTGHSLKTSILQKIINFFKRGTNEQS